jgi:HAD superfamily phosphatase (TIGR01681 family)
MGTETALEIYKSLRNAPDLEIFGADTEPLNAGFCLVEHSVITPSIYDKDLFAFLGRFIKKERMDLVFPTHDWFLVPFAERKKIGKAHLIVPDLETIRITRSKELTYKFLKDEIAVPKVYPTNKIPADIKFPLFIKPKTGRGSIQAFKVDNKKELHLYLSRVEEPLLMEYLPGKEYTIDCICDLNGRLLAISIRERIKIKGGISMIGKIVENNKISQMAGKIANRLKFKGGWFFQVKEAGNEAPTLLEINARVAGTMCLTRMAGLNIPLLTAWLFLGKELRYVPPPITNMIVTRHLTEEYIWEDMKDIKCIIWDLDDTLWYGRLGEDEVRLRPQIHCILKELKERNLILCGISRNPHLIGLRRNKIVRLLKEVGIGDVFIRLEINDRPKSENIKEIASKLHLKLNQILYIDDAFSEREEVRQNTSGVWIFDASCYSELLNIRPPSYRPA